MVVVVEGMVMFETLVVWVGAKGTVGGDGGSTPFGDGRGFRCFDRHEGRNRVILST